MSSHSDLPWVIHQDEYDKSAYHVCRSTGQPIIWSTGFANVNSVPEANAQFIVKACNNHYKLLGALMELHEIASSFFGSSELDKIVQRAEQAIKEAE